MRLYQRTPGGPWHVDLTTPAGRIRRSTGTSDKAQASAAAAHLALGQWREKHLDAQPTVDWDRAVLAWLEQNGEHRKSIETIRDRLRAVTQHLRGQALASITVHTLNALRKVADALTERRRNNAAANLLSRRV